MRFASNHCISRQARTAVLLVAGASVLAFGCGPSQELLEQQAAQEKQLLEEARQDPPGMTAEEKEGRRMRLEMDFGVTE